MILTDNETKVDLLNNEAIAATIVRLLRDKPERPITVGVHGDWGAGKSSVLEMIEASLATHGDVLCIKFNGWRYQGFEDAKIALIEGIVTGLVEKRPALAKAGDVVKNIFSRIDWLKAAKRAGGLAFNAITGIPTPAQIQELAGTVQGFIDEPGRLATKANFASLHDKLGGLFKPGTSTRNVPEEINEFREAFRGLLDKADVKQLIVLIDDLDRCLPDTAIETLEAMRLFVFTERTAFVVGADEAMIEYAVRKHFPDLPDSTGSQTYARNYLEKLIQVPFRIPALGDTETRIYVTLLLVGAELGENSPEFGKLIEKAREKLRKPWTAGGLDAGTVKAALGDKAPISHNALTLSEQIGPILASGTKGNPRQIKRFLNTLVLRQRTAEARGFGEDVNLPVLAKLMLAERFLPRVFDQIASGAAAAADGCCSDLHYLEVAISEGDAPKATPKGAAKPAGKPSDDAKPQAPKLEPVREPETSSQLVEWLSSPAVRAWAQVQPAIGRVDLRPYLFVAKDRKDYFGAASVLGHLATVAEQLFGAKFAVQALEPDLKRLAGPEAAQVFELVRGRIVGGDSFNTEPPGAAGLGVLVKAHPSLQSALVDFLEMLPRAKLGPWVCGGWEGVLKDPEQSRRFDSLLQSWEKEGGAMLKGAANATLRTRQRERR